MELEIKLMWCKGLLTFNFFQKLTVYASVSIISEDERIQLTDDQKQEQQTPVDETNEDNPEWNCIFKFDLQPLHMIHPNMIGLSLLFELRTKGQLFGDKTIGEVRVPINDLVQSVGVGVVRFVKYEVRNSEGKHNGILDFSYKIISNDNNHNNLTNDFINSNYHVQITGYHHHRHEQHYDTNIIEYQRYDHNHNNNNNNHMDSNGTFFTSNSEIIQYPKIDLDEQIPIGYPATSSSLSSSSSYYYSSSSSFTSTNATHYQPSVTLYPPPASQTWGPPPPPPPHFPPPLLQQPYVYPPPPLQQQPRGPQPYGDSHWGYHRSDSYKQW